MHAVIVCSTLPLFLGALLADWAYARTFQVQWTNFASWLIAGGLLLAGLALLWAAIDAALSRASRQRRGTMIYLLLLVGVFVLGFVNSLVHARDAWAAMPSGLVLSVLVLLLAGAASGFGLLGIHHSRKVAAA